jgi:hypothetical protein
MYLLAWQIYHGREAEAVQALDFGAGKLDLRDRPALHWSRITSAALTWTRRMLPALIDIGSNIAP